ncbi:MAG: PD-(D/E)XK nuclease family protein, partial [Verrucomicrobiota bacterium]|nr:PD-(D/E)XK nuclease family protein [Verrucomicrobiota bacterium]
LARLPDRTSAEQHWQLFRAHVSGADDFRRQLRAEKFVAHAEFPFLLKLGDTAALEGVIDLLLIAREARRALIIDWKTNRIEPRRVGTLRGKYRSQIAAYWKAVRDITGYEVGAGLYSTATGKLLIYSTAELEEEWTRLAALPAPALQEEVAPNFH